MATTKLQKCYICQKEFDSLKDVIKHIKSRHPDHVNTRAFEAVLKSTDKDYKNVQQQTDVIKMVTAVKPVDSTPVPAVKPVKQVKPATKPVVEDASATNNSDDAKSNE